MLSKGAYEMYAAANVMFRANNSNARINLVIYWYLMYLLAWY